MESTIEHSSAAAAEIGGPVTLYAPDGEPVQVAADKVELWLSRGFSRSRLDPADLVGDVVALAGALAQPWLAYHDATAARGVIDQAAQDTAHEALRLLCAAADRLHRAIHERYPVPQEDN